MFTGKKLGQILTEKGYMTAELVAEAVAFSEKENIRFGDACLRLGFIDERQLAESIAEQYGLEVIDLSESEIDEETINLIPVEILHRAKLVPIKNKGVALIVTSDPTDILTFDDVERMIKERGGRAGRLAVASSNDVEKLLNSGSGSIRILKEASSGFSGLEAFRKIEANDNVLSIEKIAEDSSPVVRLVDTVIYDAISKRASDIHLETDGEGLTVKYRIDGALHRMMEPIDRRIQASVISRIKVMSELDISERRIPQDGRFKVRIKNKTVDFRVSIMPSIYGEDAVIRILDKEHITQSFQDLRLDILGFGDREIAHLRRMIREPYGMVLVTGPTGSGKTTTLYAALSEINTGDDKIITIEDPVEYQLKGIVQIAVNEKKGLTFARGLRSILRHDPDKIMVGEIRDSETAQIAIQAALTGHLVFTTVHANNVFDVMGRFIHMGVEPYNFVSSLNCILAQRLLRLICKKCKHPVNIDDTVLKESGLSLEKHGGSVFYEGKGCDECHGTGYRGRKAIVELLDLTDEMRDLIAGKQPLAVIKKKATEEGLVTLRQTAIESVLRGETTLKEINRVTFVE